MSFFTWLAGKRGGGARASLLLAGNRVSGRPLSMKEHIKSFQNLLTDFKNIEFQLFYTYFCSIQNNRK